MKARLASTDLLIRPYRDEDEPEVLALLVRSLGRGPAGRRPPEFFRWKHLLNPFGRSLMLVGECGGDIVGFRAFMRWQFRAGRSVVRAARGVDTVTHAKFRGKGIFSDLTFHALGLLAPECDLIFNTPNDKSLPGYLKLGWTVVGTVPVAVRVRRGMAFLRGLNSLRTAGMVGISVTVDAPSAADILGRPDLGTFLQRVESDRRNDHTLMTARSADYIRWRYGMAPLLDYRAVFEEVHGSLKGLAIFRVHPRGSLLEASIAELLVEPGDVAGGHRLLKGIMSSGPIDHAICHFPRRTVAERARRRAGFISLGPGITLATRPLTDHLRPDPSRLRSWALTVGDLEVF